MNVKEVMSVKKDNHLFPIFLKLEDFSLLIVGGGKVALEKLNAVLAEAPATKIHVVADQVSESIKMIARKNIRISITERKYLNSDLDHADIIIVAVDDPEVSMQIRDEAKQKKKLVNVADRPEQCDFFLGSIVKKGNLKIAISTNGKSPTIAKRLKENFNEILPDEMEQVLDNMHAIRGRIQGDFSDKVKKLNEITQVLASKNGDEARLTENRWRKIASWCLFAFFFMFVGYLLLSFISIDQVFYDTWNFLGNLDRSFYLMILVGFLAQLVDGMLGMGYGVVSATALLSMGVNLPAISGSIHTAELFSSAASGYSHYRFGNVNKKLLKTLLIPGVIGAVIGAYLLSIFGNEYGSYIRPLLASYTLFLGIKILLSGFRKNKKPKKVKWVGWLGGIGGFLDSFGSGGWGPLVTSTLILKGRTPRYVIGSVSISEFFVTLASAVTFFTMLGISHWSIIAGLIIGGIAASPIAAKLAGKLPLKTMFISVGILVIIWSIRILLKAFSG